MKYFTLLLIPLLYISCSPVANDSDTFNGAPSAIHIAITPTPTPAINLECPLWTYPFNYIVGDCVTYNYVEYICIQNHPSLEIWTPDKYGSLWEEK